MPKIISEKPALPILWVDTAVGIKLAKVQRGELSKVERRRVVRLKELVVKLVRGCKLLCPQGEQEWEYWGERLDDKIADEFATLSRSIRMVPHQAVLDSQLLVAMRAYVGGATEFRIPSSIYFHSDPVRELQKITQQRFFASVRGLPPILLDMGNQLRKEMYSHLEELRRENVAKRRSYEEQYAFEQRGFVSGMVEFARSIQGRYLQGNARPWEYLAVRAYEQYFSEWYRLTNRWGD